MKRLTKQQAAIVGAYTGLAASSFSHVQEYAEKLLKRPVFTHEFASKQFIEKLQELSRDDFLAICYED